MAKLKFGNLKFEKNAIFILFVIAIIIFLLYKQLKSSFGEDSPLQMNTIPTTMYRVIFLNNTSDDVININLPPSTTLCAYNNNVLTKIMTLSISRFNTSVSFDNFSSIPTNDIYYTGPFNLPSISLEGGSGLNDGMINAMLLQPSRTVDPNIDGHIQIIINTTGYSISNNISNTDIQILLSGLNVCESNAQATMDSLSSTFHNTLTYQYNNCKASFMKDPTNFNSTTCATPIATAKASFMKDPTNFNSATCSGSIKTALAGIRNNVFTVNNMYNLPVTLTATSGTLITTQIINPRQPMSLVLNNTIPWTIKGTASKTSFLSIPVGLNTVDKTINIGNTGILSIV
jgi:hypothetical protein